MKTTKLSSKGRIILPKSVRDSHHWPAGTEFVIEDMAEGIMLRPAKSFRPTVLRDVVGSAGYKGPAKTLAEMQAAIAKGAAKSHAGR